MKTKDQYGNIIYDTDDVLEVLYSGLLDLSEILMTDNEENNHFAQYDKSITIYNPLDLSKEEFDEAIRDMWFTPEPFKSMDIKQFLIDKCKTDIEKNRVCEELILFEERSLLNLLRCLVWLKHTMNENNIVCGIGRGSSVSSYCLYLMGIHRIDSIKFDLDIRDFLK